MNANPKTVRRDLTVHTLRRMSRKGECWEAESHAEQARNLVAVIPCDRHHAAPGAPCWPHVGRWSACGLRIRRAGFTTLAPSGRPRAEAVTR